MSNQFEKYNDDQSIDLFPFGKIFRIQFDSSVRKLKIISKNYDLFEELRKAFSAPNSSSFFMSQYGYKTESKLYAINKFGYFGPGLIFDILQYVKLNYGSLSVVAISKNCKDYIDDYLTPLKMLLQDVDRIIYNVSKDTGRNTELVKKGYTEFIYRDYQENSVYYLLYSGYGRGLIEIPTAGGKSFILANFIWNILKSVNRNYRTMILVPNKQLVEQFYKDLVDYGYSRHLITRFTAGLKKSEQFDKDAKIVIANRQYVFKNRNKLPKIDVLIADECLRCGTLITTNIGNKKIEDIQVGDLVLSFNEYFKVWEYKPVERVHKNLIKSNSYNYFLRINLENGKYLEVTPNHRIYTKNRGYVRADELNIEDELIIN